MSDTSAVAEKGHDDSSKVKTFLSILRKFVGVADIASVRFSLPAQLLEPTPNLEYWNYLDRPETFASIGTSDDELGRMLEVLRFWFTKDLKYIKGKPCKPYNSTLGEFFRAYWEVDNATAPVLPTSNPTNGAAGSTNSGSAKVCFLTEQTSHHPPVSAFYIDCPERGVSARGFDQISAKFTGTSIRVGPGQHNLGIFVTLANRDNEEYQLTHPAAHLSGLLRGSLYISVADSCYITCPKTRIKVILQYLEDGWVSKAHSRVEGVIFRYDPDNDTKTKMKDVPSNDVLARINGCWREQVYYTLTAAAASGSSSISSRSSSSTSETNKPQLLIDLVPLSIVSKSVPPEEKQLSNESRKFWSGVTSSILSKQFSQATKLKQEIEERQRSKAAEREATAQKWKPRFFTDAVTPLGRPDLTDEGRRALEKMFKGDFELEESEVQGA
ncbi:oxysterol binding protein (Orp8), putative [Talaromyces stipitatus ATCC 10500]|uniref:Oxysterol binding protein (Orp8), putative n=1 Tax=Talaromyces stipitatus (strain ATCC 10500 / CBS 375.48 / QM 6759 / NRRL 1006) TaxID=441959 RepID=B8MNQ4_TALSN|nr:oxysterol binding protein (Orp8), putative [Talaromyces stipitatus ATCC 10500]EED14143.1 oxysterol binding protein (Orp8), putative [Talaromyces stipitatus ATCC 10500]